LWQDRAVRGRRLGLGALMAAWAAAAVPACDDATPVQRGFGSRPLVQIRDPTFAFYATKSDLVFYRTGLDTSGYGLATYWSVNLATGEVLNLGSATPNLFDPEPIPRFDCEYETDQQGLTGNFIVIDTQSGTKTVIDRVAVTDPHCP